jgi:hypothetical protein
MASVRRKVSFGGENVHHRTSNDLRQIDGAEIEVLMQSTRVVPQALANGSSRSELQRLL